MLTRMGEARPFRTKLPVPADTVRKFGFILQIMLLSLVCIKIFDLVRANFSAAGTLVSPKISTRPLPAVTPGAICCRFVDKAISDLNGYSRVAHHFSNLNKVRPLRCSSGKGTGLARSSR